MNEQKVKAVYENFRQVSLIFPVSSSQLFEPIIFHPSARRYTRLRLDPWKLQLIISFG